MATHLTMLAEMMDRDLDAAVARLSDLGITHLDLKQHVFGRPIEDLDDARRDRLAAVCQRTGTEVYCFSSTLGHRNVARVDERTFHRELERGVDNLLRTAALVRPRKTRLLACTIGTDSAADDSAGLNPTDLLDDQAPWVYAAYRDAIDRIAAAGMEPTIENEPDSVLSTPADTLTFFDRLERPGAVGFTWDVQNMWQAGVFPSLDAYQTLRPVVDYLHLKGGRGTPKAPRRLAYRSPLADATWPVRQIIAAAMADEVSPILCLNPSHGAVPPAYALANAGDEAAMVRAEAEQDVAFLRRTFAEIA